MLNKSRIWEKGVFFIQQIDWERVATIYSVIRELNLGNFMGEQDMEFSLNYIIID